MIMLNAHQGRYGVSRAYNANVVLVQIEDIHDGEQARALLSLCDAERMIKLMQEQIDFIMAQGAKRDE